MTHLLLQPLLLLLNLLLQGLAELLDLLVVLSHTPAGDSEAGAGGGQTLLQGMRVPHCPRELRAAAGFAQRGSPSEDVSSSSSPDFAIPRVAVEGAQPQPSAPGETSTPAAEGHAESTQVSPSLGASPQPHPCPQLSCPTSLHRPGVTHLFRVTSKASFLLLASWMRSLILARKSSRLPRSWGSSCRSFIQRCQISCLQGEGSFVVSISPEPPKAAPGTGSWVT